MAIVTVETSDVHKALRDEILQVMQRHAADLAADEVLAVLSYMVGQSIALQDQRKYTTDSVMALVNENIQLGNRQAVSKLLFQTTGHA